jgi:hypothetical protein
MTAKGKTLWEMLQAKMAGPAESRVYNPLGAKIGSPVTVDHPDYEDANFFLVEIHQYKRTIGSREFLSADYVVLAHQLKGNDIRLCLRISPVDDPGRAAGITYRVLLLHLYDEMAYSDDLYKVVTDNTGKFQVLDDGKVTAEYFRINDLRSSYQADVTVLKDADPDKAVDAEETETLSLEYWDYWRQLDGGPEQREAAEPSSEEFLFVEMDKASGWFQIWQGTEIDPERVTVLG